MILNENKNYRVENAAISGTPFIKKNKVETYSKRRRSKKGNDPFKLNFIASANLQNRYQQYSNFNTFAKEQKSKKKRLR